jgi:two-component system, OmpR family, sensor histidine kinase KdpD
VTERDRPNPDALLAAMQRDEARLRRGKLKVFLGMCAGVGKTYAMLEAARREFAAGRDVVIGYLETHGRKETDALAEGLPAIARRQIEYRGMQLSEFDLDAALARKPKLILVDEFAHSNAQESRHPKRYQDVLELLDAGIDVFTTLNIQHIESRAEAVAQITGVTIHETVPDTALTDAEFELVDLPPDELRARLAAGKVYLPDRAATAQDRFFRVGNLSALRELALRFTAEHVGQEVLAERQAQGAGVPWKSGQRLLVAVSASPTSASLVRWTRRLAGELHATWLAVYVESTRALSDEDQARLAKNLALARELGAKIITTTDDDVVRGLLRTAREQNATQIVAGKPAGWRVIEVFRGGSVLNRLIHESGQVDVLVVRAESEQVSSRPLRPENLWKIDFHTYAWVAGVVTGVTGLNAVLDQFVGFYALALTYLLAVVVLALFVGRGPVFFAATLSALLWNFFFLPPRFTFYITSFQDGMMFAMYFVVALVLGQLTARIRAQQTAERQREQRATALYLLTRELAESPDLAQLLAVVIQQVGKTFRADVALSLPDESQTAPVTAYFASSWALSDKEQTVAAWAFQHRQAAGRGTDNLPASEGLHLPLVAGTRATGVLSLHFYDATPLPPAQRDLLDAFIRQVALVFDRERLRDAEIQTKFLAESERMGTMLLNSVSHELRTPLAAISSAASGLRASGELNPAQQSLTDELDEAARRLNRLVRNLLDLSRLEAGHLRMNKDWHDLRDLLRSALQNLGRALSQHEVKIEIPNDLPPVKVDAILTEQILVNLLGNAAVHTPPGTKAEVSAQADGDQLVLRVADNGPGLPPGDPARLFDRFQRGPNAVAGGTGIGLSLVKGFAEAQGGSVSAENRSGGGAVFTVKLPLTKLPPVPEEKD